MLPYIASTQYHLLGFTFQTWGTFVAAGFLLGTALAARRAKAKGLESQRVVDLAFWIFLAAMIGSRIFHVLVYEPSYYLVHPLEAIDPRQPGFAIFGGFLGAALAFWLYVRKHHLNFIAYADTLMWGLPWGCGVGRIGCFLIHDHPGTLSNFMLAVKYPDGQSRHDLGLYLSLIGFATGGLFLFLNRRERRPGFWFGTYMIIEGLSRLGLDFLRVVDTRYLGMTPAQWLSIPLIVVGIWLLKKPRPRATLPA